VRMTGGVVLIWLVYLVEGGGDVNGRTGGEGGWGRELAGDATFPFNSARGTRSAFPSWSIGRKRAQ